MPTGADSYVKYGFEASFGAGGTCNKPFGHGARITTLDRRNTLRRIYGLGSRNATALLEGQFEGAFTIDFDIDADPWWFKSVLGSDTVSGTESPYTWTFSEANTPPTMVIENGIDLTTDSVATYKGVVVQECNLTCEVGEAPPHVTLTCLYANESHTSAGLGSAASLGENPYNFGHASIETPNGTTIADTERVELVINNNAALRYGLGARTGSYASYGQREYTVTTVNYFDDYSTYLQKLWGAATGPQSSASSIATLEINLSNGESAADERSIAILLSNLKINSHSLPQSVEEPIMETVEIFGRSGAITVVNDSGTEP